MKIPLLGVSITIQKKCRHKWLKPYKMANREEDLDAQPINWLSQVPTYYGIWVRLVDNRRRCAMCGLVVGSEGGDQSAFSAYEAGVDAMLNGLKETLNAMKETGSQVKDNRTTPRPG